MTAGGLGRIARRSRTEAQTRMQRLRERLSFIAQCAIGAALAWLVATGVFHHTSPMFAPVTALICLGLSYGNRVRRSFELMLGVAVGVAIGDLFVHLFGSGVWQVGLVVATAMGAAALLGSGQLLTTQAGVQAIFVTTVAVPGGSVVNRWVDAVIGGSVALAVTVLSPRAPVHRPRAEAAVMLEDLADVLRDTAQAVRAGDEGQATRALERARATDAALDQLRQSSAEGQAVVRQSPWRRRHGADVQAILDLVTPLDRAARNLRVLARRCRAVVRRGESLPADHLAILDALADAVHEVAWLLERRADPAAARADLVAVAAATATSHPTLSAAVVRGQARSMIIDLLMLTGLTEDEAIDQLPADD